jgi:glutamate carboxypeptidase
MTQTTIPVGLVEQLRDSLQARHSDFEEFLRALVETESPSGDVVGSRAVVGLISQAASTLRCVDSIECVDVPDFGQHLVIKAFGKGKAREHVLIVGHTDTVHERGSISKRPFRKEANRIYGPGIFDMKANCALVVEVLRALETLGLEPAYSVTIALTCDEEVGSSSGWPFLEQLARARTTRCALVLEPPALGGRVKTGRKGTGIYEIKVEGKAAHAGLEPQKGASAILELARQTERMHALNQVGTGITVNVGVVRGGTRSNVVAAEARGEIDVRFSTEAEAEEVDRFLSHLEPIDERTRVFVTGGINRPPLERTREVVALYQQARAVSAAIDFELGEAQVGGASDGNFLAAMGITVLDGLGISGDGAHAVHEHIEVDDIARRGALIGGLLMSV